MLDESERQAIAAAHKDPYVVEMCAFRVAISPPPVRKVRPQHAAHGGAALLE